MSSVESLKQIYEANGQSQVFTFFDSLSESSKAALVQQLSSIDPERVSNIAKSVLSTTPDSSSETEKISPLPASASASLLTASADEIAQWTTTGHNLIAENTVAVVLLAGGQGTRLGSSAPKGCFDIGLPSHKSLFELQAERILSLQKLVSRITGKVNVVIPWYIMTSGPTKQPTVSFFRDHDYFGLDPANVTFFEQGVLPCIDNQGKILLESPDKVAVAPDGNGGIYRALVDQAILPDLTRRGIKHVHAYCVDNCLVKMADPVFIGFAASRNVNVATKSVPKRSPIENVGLIVSKDGRPAVIEYSEISAEMAHRTVTAKNREELAFRTANIVNHYYSVEYLTGIPLWRDDYLPYHVARKKIPTVDLVTGQPVSPATPNGIKLEQFIFDCFPQIKLSRFANLEVLREDEFSPLKNKAGTVGEDDADSSRADLLKQGKRWLEAIGASVAPGVVGVEVPPLVSFAGENLEQFKGKSFSSEIELGQEAKI
ncbi:nucleotide-diphospho-sugar transferase [Lipomyces japonicus]|uniref:nucleotide-diphospho-sugar transferase n=1 Tax=Lipomyces japonicus TaxID=56871 RepID=UPI0034CD902F